ncbi:MAG TPA: hypothetical protein DCG77_12195 [Sphingobacterium sp.]|nr:hypothetical protein [Sphingobacterium sp.]
MSSKKIKRANTKIWMDKHFKSCKERWVYFKFIFNQVKEFFIKVWNCHEFFNYMALKTIEYMAQINAYPRVMAFILIGMKEAYWSHGHDLYPKVKYS